jgi:hypothetical protein
MDSIFSICLDHSPAAEESVEFITDEPAAALNSIKSSNSDIDMRR